jgi:Ca2+-transporting ATPase
VRSERESLWRLGLFSNPLLLGAVLLTLVLQLAIIYVPVLNDLFGTQPLRPRELALTFAGALLVMGVVEIEKAIRRRRRA